MARLTVVPLLQRNSTQRTRWAKLAPTDEPRPDRPVGHRHGRRSRFAEAQRWYAKDPVAQGDEQVEAPVSDEVPSGPEAGWPVLSDLDLEVCAADTAIPAPPTRSPDAP